MTTDFMYSGVIMNFFTKLLVGVVSVAIVGLLTGFFGESLKYILGLAGLAYLFYVIFFMK